MKLQKRLLSGFIALLTIGLLSCEDPLIPCFGGTVAGKGGPDCIPKSTNKSFTSVGWALDIYGADSVLATGYIKYDSTTSIISHYFDFHDFCKNATYQTGVFNNAGNEINFPSLPDSTFTFTYKLDSINTIGCEYNVRVRGRIRINETLVNIDIGRSFILQDSTYRLCYSPILSLPNCK